jgi:Ca2+-binding EF-hand superfamily protein
MKGLPNPLRSLPVLLRSLAVPLRSLAVLGTIGLWIGCGKSTDVGQSPTQPAPSSESVASVSPDRRSPQAPTFETESIATEPAREATPMAAVEKPAMMEPEAAAVEPSDASELEQPELEQPAPEIPIKVAQQQAPNDTTEQQPAADPPALIEPAARLLLPTTAGPLIVDVEIVIGDQPLHDAFAARIQAVMEQAGGSTELSWDSLFDHIAADQQQFGRAAAINARQRRDLIRRYDRNRNKRPDHDEVARFLFRNSGFAGPFRIAGSNQYREFNRSQSAIFAVADRNGDHVLGADEIDRIGQSLLRLDQNADERLDVTEVASAVGDGDAAWKNDSASRWGDVAMDVLGYVDWSMLTYSLDEMPRHGPFGRERNSIEFLDHDDDDSIDREEARELLNVEADIRLRASFPKSAAGQARLQTLALCKELEPLVDQSTSADRISISSDSFRLTASISDLGTTRQQIPPQAFAALDADNDGGLDQTEIPAAALREYSFEDLDQDGDEKLTLREINEGMSPKQPIWSIQVRARGAETPDALFAWLDENQDQFLSTREIIGASRRLRSRASSDGTVHPSDIPDSYLIRFGRGDPSQDEQLLALTPLPPSDRGGQANAWPSWAHAMDSNRDGEISRGEFPGTSQQFDLLDTNRDDFVDSDEISQSVETE